MCVGLLFYIYSQWFFCSSIVLQLKFAVVCFTIRDRKSLTDSKMKLPRIMNTPKLL